MRQALRKCASGPPRAAGGPCRQRLLTRPSPSSSSSRSLEKVHKAWQEFLLTFLYIGHLPRIYRDPLLRLDVPRRRSAL